MPSATQPSRFRGRGYFQELLRGLGLVIPNWLGTDYRSAVQAAAEGGAGARGGAQTWRRWARGLLRDAQALQTAPHLFGLPLVFNLPAFAIVILVTWVVLIGIRETAGLNTGLVIAKLAIVLFFLALGAFYVKPENWTPFAPHGFKGVSSAAAIIFFAYIGFDTVSTAAEETRNPQRNMPIGIMASLVICTVLYVAVAAVLTGMARWDTLGNAEPLAAVFSALGMNWTAGIIALGAGAGHDIRARAVSSGPTAHFSFQWAATVSCPRGLPGYIRASAHRTSQRS